MEKTSKRSRPSVYPRIPFHVIRTGILISTLVVTSTLSFFVYHLRRDDYRIPWTFLVLFAASLLTLLSLTVTLGLHLCHVLSPLINLIVNIFLLIFWIVGMSMLGWNMTGTLGHACSIDNWGSDVGIMVCQVYKTSFAFSVLATLFTMAMIVVDVRARRSQTRLGKYDQMRDSTYEKNPTQASFSSSALDRHHEEPVEPWQTTGHEASHYQSWEPPRSAVQSARFGYVSPSEQTRYNGGSYGNRDI